MAKLLGELEREATAFGLFFGYQVEPMTLKAIGEKMNISQPRVRVLSNRAFRRLIHPRFRREVWEEYGYKETANP
jgi:DNA-directed RNA polymerase sigma subunit (sigma70/sigma32)